jgi:hypothetical protein
MQPVAMPLFLFSCFIKELRYMLRFWAVCAVLLMERATRLPRGGLTEKNHLLVGFFWLDSHSFRLLAKLAASHFSAQSCATTISNIVSMALAMLTLLWAAMCMSMMASDAQKLATQGPRFSPSSFRSILPASTVEALDKLSPNTLSVAMREAASMPNFEPDRMFVSPTGKWFVVDRIPQLNSRRLLSRDGDQPAHSARSASAFASQGEPPPRLSLSGECHVYDPSFFSLARM